MMLNQRVAPLAIRPASKREEPMGRWMPLQALPWAEPPAAVSAPQVFPGYTTSGLLRVLLQAPPKGGNPMMLNDAMQRYALEERSQVQLFEFKTQG